MMNEMAVTKIPIFNELSAPLAYIITPSTVIVEMIANILKMIEDYAENVSSTMGNWRKVQIINCGQLKTIWVGLPASKELCNLANHYSNKHP